jgi:hypothetical protein
MKLQLRGSSRLIRGSLTSGDRSSGYEIPFSPWLSIGTTSGTTYIDGNELWDANIIEQRKARTDFYFQTAAFLGFSGLPCRFYLRNPQLRRSEIDQTRDT